MEIDLTRAALVRLEKQRLASRRLVTCRSGGGVGVGIGAGVGGRVGTGVLAHPHHRLLLPDGSDHYEVHDDADHCQGHVQDDHQGPA